MNSLESSVSLPEVATVFRVRDEIVVGVLHSPAKVGKTGVLFIVGGRQYRTGAQRQFVRLGRCLASAGFPAFRFDVRGMGDSSAAEPRFFLETTDDITAAIAEFRRLSPDLDRLLLWGLCDGASAAAVYAAEHQNVGGVMMVNPWVTTKSGAARTTLKHYYQKRLVSAGFWRQLINGKIDPLQSLRSLGLLMRHRFGNFDNHSHDEPDLPTIVFAAIEHFDGEFVVVISEKDLTASEFKDEHDRRYNVAGVTSPVEKFTIVQADHTFSTPDQHDQLEMLTLNWCYQQVGRTTPDE